MFEHSQSAKRRLLLLLLLATSMGVEAEKNGIYEYGDYISSVPIAPTTNWDRIYCLKSGTVNRNLEQILDNYFVSDIIFQPYSHKEGGINFWWQPMVRHWLVLVFPGWVEEFDFAIKYLNEVICMYEDYGNDDDGARALAVKIVYAYEVYETL
ncbi:hypothetical protein FF38_00853 [Lucilia cuprina]|uniref:Uncharacterized protein n=1 Tax=Lucilia cuprina TaxID=7375 RepID=A0A0L0C1U1_LUCCU|nr:hypothetical protein FF38_00853 [Lucilia cuprina]